ncbi:MAG: hypothetical protein AAFZ15_24490 [Bacteroidota bacterium]
MKNLFQNWKQALNVLFFFLGFLASGFPSPSSAVTTCDCSSPDVTKTSQTASSVTFSLSDVDGATAYKSWYSRTEDGFTSQEVTTTGSSIVYSNLPAGTYVFYFVTICGGQTSGIIITDDLMM